MNNQSKIASLVLTGLAIGAAAWYLLATEKGKQTCERIGNSLKDFNGSVSDLKNTAKDAIDQFKGQAESVADNLKSKVKSAAARTEAVVN